MDYACVFTAKSSHCQVSYRCLFVKYNFYVCCNLFISILCFLLGISPASELYMPTFRNTLSVPSSQAGDIKYHLPMKMEQTECSETSAYIIQTPGNYPKENIIYSEHGESMKSRMKYKISTNNRQQKETNSLICLLSPFPPPTQLVLRRNKHSLSKMMPSAIQQIIHKQPYTTIPVTE